jgi:hypothetical protein
MNSTRPIRLSGLPVPTAPTSAPVESAGLLRPRPVSPWIWACGMSAALGFALAACGDSDGGDTSGGGGCTNDKDCGDLATCVDGTCQNLDTEQLRNGRFNPNGACKTALDCPGGQVCNAGACAPADVLGCTSAADCPNTENPQPGAYTCASGKCQLKVDTAASLPPNNGSGSGDTTGGGTDTGETDTGGDATDDSTSTGSTG